MARERPHRAPRHENLGDPNEVVRCQRKAFLLGDEDRWCYGEESGCSHIRDGRDGWMPDHEELASATHDPG